MYNNESVSCVSSGEATIDIVSDVPQVRQYEYYRVKLSIKQ